MLQVGITILIEHSLHIVKMQLMWYLASLEIELSGRKAGADGWLVMDAGVICANPRPVAIVIQSVSNRY